MKYYGVAFLSATFALLDHSAGAVPITPGTPSLILSEISANDVGRTTGERILILDDGVFPNSAGGTSIVASTTETSTGKPVAKTLVNSPADTVFSNQFGVSIPYSPNLLQPWTLDITNGANQVGVTTPSLVGVAPIPFASNVTVSGSSANPTFAWTYPTGSVDGTIINVIQHTSSGGTNTVYSTSLPGTANSFTVPTALAGGLSLTQGTIYTLDVYGVKLRQPTGRINNSNSASWSEAFFDFTPLASGSPLVNLPMVSGSTGAYQYNMTVVGGQTYFIDPTVATGYTYAIGAGNPNFASVLLPAIQTSPFDVSFLDNGHIQTDPVDPNIVFDFPTGGVDTFTVTGIDPADGLDPGNTTAFDTGLTFVSSGTFTGTQTPITISTDVPEPASLLVLLTSLAALIWSRRSQIASCSAHHFARRGIKPASFLT